MRKLVVTKAGTAVEHHNEGLYFAAQIECDATATIEIVAVKKCLGTDTEYTIALIDASVGIDICKLDNDIPLFCGDTVKIETTANAIVTLVTR